MSIHRDETYCVIGLGQTGLSCIKYLIRKGCNVTAIDTRAAPPFLSELTQYYPEVDFFLGPLSEKKANQLLSAADTIVVSPGVPLSQPELLAAKKQGKKIIGDIEIFSQAVQAPIVAITGTNGKSSVTSLVGEMAKAANVNVAVAGNIGKPVLDLLFEPARALYVLELSSYQLEYTQSLKAKAAVILNLAPDHLDRYPDLASYLQAKQKIYIGCDTAVLNLDDAGLWEGLSLPDKTLSFSRENGKADFYLGSVDGERHILHQGEPLIALRKIHLNAEHQIENALAALALGAAVGLPMPAMLTAIAGFKGLAHRSEWVARINNVTWINDSKATNAHALASALKGFAAGMTEPHLILIAGGQVKKDDFSSLPVLLAKWVKYILLIGEGADVLQQYFAPSQVPIARLIYLQDAVALAKVLAKPGDLVLFSPACASFDQFKNFEDRGNQFKRLVKQYEK